MITEDYVSFETSKLLEEKGFDEPTLYHFIDGNDIITHDSEYKLFRNSELVNAFNAPTLQMAMKWLRQVHGIHINVFRYPAAFLDDNNEQHKPWWFQYTLLKPIKEIDIDSHMINDEFESAEEAMDYAIKYCLENLI